MSGTFYHSPAPGEPPFVKLGDKVTKGQTIGIIEAMKLMNEIEVHSGVQRALQLKQVSDRDSVWSLISILQRFV